MVSRKLMAPALAGTGAAGASGTLAWTLSLLDGEKLGGAGKKKAEPPSSAPRTANSISQGGIQGRQVLLGRTILRKLEITGTTPTGQYFTSGTATEKDKKVIRENLTWKVEWNDGLEMILVKAGENGKSYLWNCQLKPITFNKIENDEDSYSELEHQGGELINTIKDNPSYKEKFVENCSKAGAVTGGEIELETEEVGGKVKFKESNEYFKKLWTQDFTGVEKLSDDDEMVNKREGWNIEETKEERNKTAKVKISLVNKELFCSISGTYKGNLGRKKFKSKEFEEDILGLSQYSYYEVERKKYLIRNCKKHNKEITGLTVQTVGNNEWKFKDLEKITEGMYTNPK